MPKLTQQKQEIAANGFTIVEGLFSEAELDAIIAAIDRSDTLSPNFRKSAGLFAIRQFFMEVPEVVPLVFTQRLNSLIDDLLGTGYFVVKSIYFDKPEASNWFVAYHQDLTISVDRKEEVAGFAPWTVKQDQYAVKPPLEILECIFTIRIHLDDTDEHNGALKVIPGSHLKGIYRAETIDWTTEKETICHVKKGGAMIMKPLLLHASGRTINAKKRRVIHVEFCSQQLPRNLKWAELLHAQRVNSVVI